MVGLMLVGCADGQARTVPWSVKSSDPTLIEQAAAIEATIMAGGCDAYATADLVQARYREVFLPHSVPPSPRDLKAGTYGFRIRVRDASCRVVAEGCTTMQAPFSDEVSVMVRPAAAESFACSVESCSCGVCESDVGATRGECDVSSDAGGDTTTSSEIDSSIDNVDGGEPIDAPIATDAPFEIDAPIDMNPDVGPTDSGPMDQLDAPLDEPDTGEPDTGMPDTGEPDSGPVCVLQTWYLDADHDGYGRLSTSVNECTAPAGYVDIAGDCDDSDASVHPSASETCDSIDNDCNGLFDDDGSASGAICGCAGFTFGGSNYLFCDTIKTWSAARPFCQSHGYDLVRVDTAEENTFLTETTSALPGTVDWWLGLSDADVEGTWLWADGTPASYTHWNPGQPDGSATRDQDCVYFIDGHGGWQDLGCTYNPGENVICEK